MKLSFLFITIIMYVQIASAAGGWGQTPVTYYDNWDGSAIINNLELNATDPNKYPAKITETADSWIFERKNDVLTVPKSIVDRVHFYPNKISFEIETTKGQIAAKSITNGTNQRYIPIPKSALNLQFLFDDVKPDVLIDNGTSQWYADPATYWYSKEGGQTRFNFNTIPYTNLASSDKITLIFNSWLFNNSEISGLADVGSYSAPTVFQENGIWTLIAGNNSGLFTGFTWNGASWALNTSETTGLTDVGFNSAPAIFQENGVWTLIAGNSTGLFTGFTWNGASWALNTTETSGLADVGGYSTPAVFQENGVWTLIAGNSTGLFTGFTWNGASWALNTTETSGLADVGGYSTSAVFQENGIWTLIAGNGSGLFTGFTWNGASWALNTTETSGLADVGDYSSLAVFQENGIWTLISGEFVGNFYGYSRGTPLWLFNNSEISGLADVGSNSTPAVFQENGIWTLIAGNGTGLFTGFTWNGASWALNTTETSGLADVGDYSSLAVFQENGIWTLIAGNSTGLFTGFTWNGASWALNTTETSGLADVGDYSSLAVFQENGIWTLIAGNSTGLFTGFTWNGASWALNTTETSGLTDVGSNSAPAVFQENGIWTLIAGNDSGLFTGFTWNGATWALNTSETTGLADVGFNSAPAIFQEGGIWTLIAGKSDGTFYGYNWYISTASTPPTPINPISIPETTSVVHSWSAGSGSTTDSYRIDFGNGTWINDTTAHTYTHTGLTTGDWSNLTIYAYNEGGTGTTSVAGLAVSAQTTTPPTTFIPPAPITPGNTTGNFWVENTWGAGAGNVSDSYRIDFGNGTWLNGTTSPYNHTGLGAHGTSALTIYAFNSSSTGTTSLTGLAVSKQIPNNPVTIGNTSAIGVNEGDTVHIDFTCTDADTDTCTFSSNRTDLFTDFSSSTGAGNWITTFTNAGIYPVDFGVQDGYGSTSNYTTVITVTDVPRAFIPPPPINPSNTTGNFWVLNNWDAGIGNVSDNYRIKFSNGTWLNGTVSPYNHTGLSAHGTSAITIYAYNSSEATATSLNGLAVSKQIPNNVPSITNTSDIQGNELDNIHIAFGCTDADSDTCTYSIDRTDLFTNFDINTGAGDWVTDLTDAGVYTLNIGANDGYVNVNMSLQITIGNTTFIPPVPVLSTTTTGNFWINQSWIPGVGNASDSYRININGTVITGITDLFYNSTGLSPHAFANISVLAYNSTGTMVSATSVSENKQVPNNLPTIGNTSNSEPSYYSGMGSTTVTINNVTDIIDGDAITGVTVGIVFSGARSNYTTINIAGTETWTLLFTGGTIGNYNITDIYATDNNSGIGNKNISHQFTVLSAVGGGVLGGQGVVTPTPTPTTIPGIPTDQKYTEFDWIDTNLYAARVAFTDVTGAANEASTLISPDPYMRSAILILVVIGLIAIYRPDEKKRRRI